LSNATKRVLSGMRPTGRLHIGHYFGALENWVRLQGDAGYECFYFVADWHALTSDYADTSGIAENTLQITIDFLASGLDPEKSVMFVQSLVPEHAELHLLLSMVTPLGWLERVPTYKEQLENIKNKDLHTYGFLGYPTLQTADIVMYSKAGMGLVVPVGEDQVSHVEFSRELVRRFQVFYARPDWSRTGKNAADHILQELRNRVPARGVGMTAEETAERALRLVDYDLRQSLLANHEIPLEIVLVEPDSFLTPTPRVPGLDGRKMSKSYGNAITLSEADADIRAKTKVMVTDPARKRRTDPGNPDVCPVYDWHKLFAPKNAAGEYTAEGKATLDWSATGCRTAGIGCIECKAAMADNLIKWIAPVRERRVKYEQNPKAVLEILDAGSAKARKSAKETMGRVREAVFHWESKRASL
jgi:tryptophanyl-tRNA synthetase